MYVFIMHDVFMYYGMYVCMYTLISGCMYVSEMKGILCYIVLCYVCIYVSEIKGYYVNVMYVC